MTSDAAAAAAAAAEAAREGKPGADEAARAAAGNLQRAAEEMGRALSSRERAEALAARQRSLRAETEGLAASGGASGGKEDAERTAALREAARAMERAESTARAGDASGAAPAAREAAERLAAAAGSLGSKAAEERTRAEEELKRLAERERAAAEEMKRLADRLRERKDLPGSGAAARSMDAASEASSDAASGNPRAAPEVKRNLDQAKESLRDPRARERQKEVLKDPLRDQDALAGATRDFAKSMAEGGDGGGSESAAGAAESMEKASESMEKGEGAEAEEEQREAERRLREIQKELDREQNRYESLRQEELLFRIAKELASLVEGQTGVNLKVRDVDDKREAAGGALSRFDTLTLGEIGDAEKALASRADWIATSIEKEESPVYAFVMRSIAEDMVRLADLLVDRETGISAQVLGAEVVRRLQDLADALKKQREEQMKAMKENRAEGDDPGGDGGQPQETRPSLVPPAAELRMLKTLQDDVNVAIEDMNTELGKDDAIDEDLRREVERLARRQSRLRDLWLVLARKFNLPTEEEGAPAEAPPEEGR